MTVHPFNPGAGRPDASTAFASDADDDPFPYDYHQDFADFDDADESMRRYGSVDRQYRYAHRTVSATMLAALTGIQVPVCQAFHHAFFAMLEDVGDFDGLVATPSLLVAGRGELVSRAAEWLVEHPAPDVPSLFAAADPDEPVLDREQRISELVDGHSLGLSTAADTNPSLTIGSLTALQYRLIDDVVELVGGCQLDEIDRLTVVAIELLRRLPGSVRPIGGAVLHRLDAGEASDTAAGGMIEVWPEW